MVKGIIFMSSWNTDGGVTRHAFPIVNWLLEKGVKVKVLTHYRETPHGFNLSTKDEDFVVRCYSLQGKQVNNLPSFESEVMLELLNEGYNVFVAQDLGMLPMEDLLKIFPMVKEKTVAVLVNHDNVPKPRDSIFWKFDWDAVVNFLPEQMEFMKEFYAKDKLYLVEFPCYPIPDTKEDTFSLREHLKLPLNKKIILLFGEYKFVDPFEILRIYRQKNQDVYLLALVYTEKEKRELQDHLLKLFNESYDDIRVEVSGWMKRFEYVKASDLVILDKGKNITGQGAVLSSTAFQIIGWGTPLLARENRFFHVFNDHIEKFRTNEEFLEKLHSLLNNEVKRREAVKKQLNFWKLHSPEKIGKEFLKIIEKLLDKKNK